LIVREPTGERELELDAKMRAVALRLQLASQVSARSYGGTGGGHPDSKPPDGVFGCRPEWEGLLEKYNAALSDTGREAVIRRAEKELSSWHRASSGVVAVVSIEALVIEDGEGYDAQMVAERYGLNANHVRRIRQRAERRADNGVRLDAERLPTDKRRLEARRMREKGMSTRQIATCLGVKQPTIVEDLRVAA
jgi:hypothetical protein